MKTSVVITFLISLHLFVSGETRAQEAPDFLVPQNADYTKPEGMKRLLATFQPIYDFKPNEKIASIGAGQGVREIVFSLMADSLTFYLQDLDPRWIEPEKIATLARYVYKQAGQSTHMATFVPVRGGQDETRLPRHFFDKIIIENSLHEFSHQAELLQSIRQNLMPDGQVFVWEVLAKKAGRKHPDCRKLMFTNDSLVQLLEANGFEFVAKTAVPPSRWSGAVLQFRLAQHPLSE